MTSRNAQSRELWAERADVVARALLALVDEHGAPNRFATSEVCAAIPRRTIPVGAVYRVGRYRLADVAAVMNRDRDAQPPFRFVLNYSRGIFAVLHT